MAIDKGSFVRKSNYEFFKNFYLDGKPEFLPAIFIVTIKPAGDDSVTINGEKYPLKSLVEITEAEATALCQEFKEMKLSEASLDDLSNQHIRRDTGEAKKAQTYGHALRYVFSYNKKNPGEYLQAYQCTECGEIHCGRAPMPKPEDAKHKHDCNNCTFLGTFANSDTTDSGVFYDLYYCPQGAIPTVIARHGEGGNYMSGMAFGIANKEDVDCPLGEAYRRANKLNLV
jgi:hypothetical protein